MLEVDQAFLLIFPMLLNPMELMGSMKGCVSLGGSTELQRQCLHRANPSVHPSCESSPKLPYDSPAEVLVGCANHH